MQRWEPPVASEPVTPARTRSPLGLIRGQDAIPEAAEIIIPRLAIGFALILPSSGRVPVIWLSLAGPLLVVALLGMGTMQSRWGTRLSQTAWVMDGISLGILTPILLVNAFAATGSGPLHRAETSVYLQTVIAAAIVLLGMTLYGSRLPRRQASSWGILLLPASLTAVALLSAFADYKTTSIVLALSISWFVAAAVSTVSQVASGGLAIVLPAVSYAVYVFVSAFVTGSGLSFGGRPAPISFVHPVLIVVLGLSLLATLVQGGRRSRGDVRPRTRRAGGNRTGKRPPRREARSSPAIDLDDLDDFRT